MTMQQETEIGTTTDQRELLRLATAGSVDDGKSTLIGRLLLDTKLLLSDQLEAVSRPRRHARPGRDHRRPARRARAGDHDRRRLSVLRDSAPDLHPRRHPRARALHAQHVHRRLDRGPRDRADRRARAACSSRPAVTPRSRRCCGSVTWSSRSTRWISSGSRSERFEEVSREAPRARPGARPAGHAASSRSPRWTATTSSTARRGRRGTRAVRCWTSSRPSTCPPIATSSARTCAYRSSGSRGPRRARAASTPASWPPAR